MHLSASKVHGAPRLLQVPLGSVEGRQAGGAVGVAQLSRLASELMVAEGVAHLKPAPRREGNFKRRGGDFKRREGEST